MSELKINDRLGWRNRLNMINTIIKKLMPLTRLEIKKGSTNKIIQSENNTVIEVSNIPEGYEEQSITLCVNGTATTGKILFKPD